MNTVTTPEPISSVKDFLSKPQKLLIDGKNTNALESRIYESRFKEGRYCVLKHIKHLMVYTSQPKLRVSFHKIIIS